MAGAQPHTVGKRLREARQHARMSQAEVANRAGLSTSFVRLVESGASDISLSRLLRWAALFDLPVADLFADRQGDLVVVTRPPERVEVPLRERGVRFQLLAPQSNNEIEPAIFTLAAAAAMRRPLRHRGEETLFVLAGRIHLEVDDHSHELQVGDSAYYRSALPHRFSNPDPHNEAQILVTTSHPALHHTRALLRRETDSQ